MRRALVAAALSMVTVAAVLGGGAEAQRSPAVAARVAPTVGMGSKPNIVLILTDDQSPATLPHWGSKVPMPLLEARLADPAEPWITFTNAWLNTPLCCPSRATILTGRYSHHTLVTTNSAASKLDENHTIATWLDGAGYETSLIGKYLNPYPFKNRGNYTPPGWDDWHAKSGANTKYYDYTLIENGTPVFYGTGEANYQTDVLRDKAVDFIQDAPSDEPFFLMWTPQAPHGPFTPALRHRNAFKGIPDYRTPAVNEADVSDKPAWVQALPLRTPKEMDRLDNYRRKQMELLLSVDEAIEAILDAIDAGGHADDTVVIVMTDNGFAFGEHRWSYKKCVYEACTRTPFYVRFPGATRHTETRLVSNVDLAPTFTDLAGTTPDISQDGMSLMPLLAGPDPATWRDAVLMYWKGERGAGSQAEPFWAIRTQDFLYAELIQTGEKELYDITGVYGPADPYELENRAGQPAYAAVQAQLAARLAELKST
jgi:arylsulfatase A-like enzyme